MTHSWRVGDRGQGEGCHQQGPGYLLHHTPLAALGFSWDTGQAKLRQILRTVQKSGGCALGSPQPGCQAEHGLYSFGEVAQCLGASAPPSVKWDEAECQAHQAVRRRAAGVSSRAWGPACARSVVTQLCSSPDFSQ